MTGTVNICRGGRRSCQIHEGQAVSQCIRSRLPGNGGSISPVVAGDTGEIRMEVGGYLRVIADRWIVVAAAALVGLLCAVAYVKATPKTYTADAKLFVAPSSTQAAEVKSPTSVYSASQFVLQRIPSYTQLAGSGQVLEPVIRSLGLNETASQLAAQVTVTNPTASVVLDVAAKGRKPTMTAAVANAVASELATTIETLERADSKAPSPVVVTLTQQASVPTVPSSPKRTLDLAFGLILGLAIGMGTAVLLARRDDTIKDARDIREIAGTPPLALIRAR